MNDSLKISRCHICAWPKCIWIRWLTDRFQSMTSLQGTSLLLNHFFILYLYSSLFFVFVSVAFRFDEWARETSKKPTHMGRLAPPCASLFLSVTRHLRLAPSETMLCCRLMTANRLNIIHFRSAMLGVRTINNRAKQSRNRNEAKRGGRRK